MGAFEQLYQRHNRRVYSLCLRMTSNVSEAEDLAQEVFIQLFRKIGSFPWRVGLYHLAAPSNRQSGLDALPQARRQDGADNRRR